MTARFTPLKFVTTTEMSSDTPRALAAPGPLRPRQRPKVRGKRSMICRSFSSCSICRRLVSRSFNNCRPIQINATRLVELRITSYCRETNGHDFKSHNHQHDDDTTTDQTQTITQTTVVNTLQEFLQTTTTSTSPPIFIGDPTITRVELADLNAVGPTTSAVGNIVAFLATTQLPGNNGANGSQAVYVYDRLANTIKSVSDPAVFVGHFFASGRDF